MSARSKPISLVTGGAGFIGSHMVDELLENGHHVRVIDNLSSGHLGNLKHLENEPNLTVKVGDIRTLEPTDPLFKDVDYVFHFAGMGDIVPSIEKPVEYMATNVLGTVHVLEASKHANVKKLIYAASSSCYGLATELPTKETSTIQPQYPYALSKYQGEQAVFHWGKVYKLRVNSIRMFNVYGPRSRTSGAYGAVFGVFLKQKLANKPFTVVGDGTQTRDFIFVRDVTAAFLTLAVSDITQEIFNVGAGNPQSVNTLIRLLQSPVGTKNLPKRPGEPECTWADISKIQRLLNWNPKYSFEDGVAIVLKNIDYWKDAPLWDEESIKVATAQWFKALSVEEGVRHA